MSVVSCKKDNTDEPANTPAKYTIMLYGCGGGDIDSQLGGALEGVVKALGVENNQVSYTVMYSMSKKTSKEDFPDSFRGEKGKTYRYVLSKDTDLTQAGYRSKYFYKNASEVELYKASTLTDFIKWSMEKAPAENYILELMNHGGGFDLETEVLTKGIIYDDNQKDKDGYNIGLGVVTIAEALRQAGTHLKAIADANVYRISAAYIHDAEGKTVTTKEGTFSLGISLYAGQREDDYQYTTYKANYKASAFDKATGWSKWLDMNEYRVSTDDEHPNLTNPGNDTSWELFWLDD